MNVVEPAVRHDDQQVPVFRVSGNGSHNVVGGRDVPGIGSVGLQVANDLLRVKALFVWERRSKDRRKHDVVGLPERTGEVLLKHAPA